MQNGRYVKNKPVNTYECEICTYLCKKRLTICTYGVIVRPCKRDTKVFKRYYIVFQMQL